MKKYAIRFNKTAGQPGRGTPDHVWRVFEEDKEFIFKNVKINVPCFGAKTGEDWSMVCYGHMHIDRDTSTATIKQKGK